MARLPPLLPGHQLERCGAGQSQGTPRRSRVRAQLAERDWRGGAEYQRALRDGGGGGGGVVTGTGGKAKRLTGRQTCTDHPPSLPPSLSLPSLPPSLPPFLPLSPSLPPSLPLSLPPVTYPDWIAVQHFLYCFCYREQREWHGASERCGHWANQEWAQ